MRATLCLALAWLAACHDSAPATPADRARAEFAGSYPEQAAPTGVVRTFDITAAETELPLVDGKPLKVWAYNGQVPGPTLRIKLGETLRVRFTNKLPQETTIHWHGVRLPNAMDGVPYITQKPVQPGETFVYEFTPKDAGTFWFHPHVRASEQVERGLYGVLVVDDIQPQPYSRDLVWVVDDFLLDNGQIYPQFNTRHDLAMDGRWGNAITINGRSDTVLKVQPGERLRIRMLNSANGRVFTPDFGDLSAKIIAVDGLYLRAPIPAHGFELAPGNRIDVDVTFDHDSPVPFEVIDRFYEQRPNKLARFEVEGPFVDTPRFASPAHAKVPRWDGALEVPIAHTFKLNAQQGGPFGIAWTIDGQAFMSHEHAMPPLATLPRGKFSHLHFTNESPRIHPIHTHGMFFRLLARNGQPVDEPFFRDTVLIHPREEVDIGLVPTDAGTWMMHCHILEHAEAGMMTTIAVTDGAPTP
ncbi:MAG TPA: multicopper oxidase family protein [Kofleriaceae bacterium]|nr:multicopper oxidase family protein [Kofleriaceae bacterium]